ncbi:MAG: PD40 domain-containing protein, partial [Proteobacteria bacterium]|nr:PD40 domain-containing protein [Pseudomonadota bacterium]
LDDQAWLISAPTGQDVIFDLPAGTDPLYSDLSPDGTRFAFVGRYQPDPEDPESLEGGLWVFDMTTGEMTKLLNGYIKTPIAWAPDSRHIVADTAEGYVVHHPLVVVDAETGGVQDLGVDGAGGIFSPDGHRIAYCGEFQSGGSWAMGVPTSGRIMIYDLEAGEAVPISPAGEGALRPRWSPDGRWIAYYATISDEREPETGRHARTWALSVAAADGSATCTTLESDERLAGYAWMPSGDALYLVTEDGIRIIAPDGSGVLSDLGGNAQDSVLSSEQAVQTEAALDAVREAVFQYAMGNVRRFEGRAAEAQAAFQTAADIFAGISWDYPLAQFSHAQLLLYADTAVREASRPGEEVLLQSCKERIQYLETLLAQYVGNEDQFPPSLEALEQHALEAGWTINWISNRDTEWVKMMFRCPVCGSFSYHAPAEEPDFGYVLVSCSCHPDHQLIWTMRLAQQVSWHQGAAVGEAERENEQLPQLLEEAEDIRHRASMGVWVLSSFGTPLEPLRP